MNIYDRIFGETADGEIHLNHPDLFLGASTGPRAVLLQLLGYLDQAKLSMERSLEQSRFLKRPFALALSWNQTAQVHLLRRETDAVLAAAQRSFDLSVAHGLPMWRSEARVMVAWARVVLTKDTAAFRDIEESLAERVVVSPRGRTFAAVVHGDACLRMGEIGRGLSTIDDAIAFGEDADEGAFMSELYRIKGQLWATTDRAAADAYLTRAFELAQEASAKLFELRAAIDLARLWQSSERYGEAVSRLAMTFDWFTEGFSCVDLIEAKQMLDESRAQFPDARQRLA